MINAKDFNMRLSIESGQPLTFYSDHSSKGNEESLKYITSEGAMEIYGRRVGKGMSLDYNYVGNYTNASARREIIRRMGLSHDIASVYKSINTDPFINDSIGKMYGMRVTENEPWETMLCFITSQFNNIKRIRGIIKNMINKYGEEYTSDGRTVKLFPTAERIARLDMEELRLCGMGFRAKYIRNAANACVNGVDLNEIYAMDYDEAKRTLMELDGVGDKVADCILLFGYGKLESFPIDLWIKRIVENVYFKGRKKSIREIHGFAEERWGNVAGYAQQYLFWQGRSLKIK